MSTASINGVTVVKGRLNIPSWGNWHADLWCDRPIALTSPATLRISDLVGTCTIVRSVDWTGQRGVRVVGGYGGWRRTVAAQEYNNPPGLTVSTVVTDTATAVGEQVTVTTDRAIGSQWIREAGAAGKVLQALAPGAWFIGLDGVTIIGPRTTGTIVSQWTATWVEQPSNILRIATEAVADWLPGKTYANGQVQGTISRVMHVIDAGKLRTEVVNV